MKTFPLVLALAVVALPCWAANRIPTSTPSPFLLAQAQQNMQATLMQTAILTEVGSFSFDPGAKSAHLTGRGAATLDSGVNKAPGGTMIDITIADTDNSVFAQCQGPLSADLSHGHVVNIGGHGFYHIEMQNGAISQAVITIQQLTDCSVN